ncbi:hypothetical protein GYMLUDRAFT_598524 [Collybiopsis luxurians FD-317 M1]|uniref:Uncharacterized protein n=1 Tax=Collybiopsis luxurians FD-317 M1 TaxID=944289 RepID=A0A0D0CXI5_9AGAR|nr:hypothetical protein GYMLUDRAFT_598524 [Collybiopsis luxurians FD-317 M1]
MSNVSSTTTAGGADEEKYLLTLEKLEKSKAMVRDIETKTESPDILLRHAKLIRELSNEVKNVLNMVLYEHGRADEQQREEILSQLENRFQEFFRTVEDCKQLIDVLCRRNSFTAWLMRVRDLRRVKKLQEEVKKRRVDLE